MRGGNCNISNRDYIMARIIFGWMNKASEKVRPYLSCGISYTRDMDKNEQTVVVQRVFDSTGRSCEILSPGVFLDIHGRHYERGNAKKPLIFDQFFFKNITN